MLRLCDRSEEEDYLVWPLDVSLIYFCQAQFQLASSVKLAELRLALILIISTPTHPPPPGIVVFSLPRKLKFGM